MQEDPLLKHEAPMSRQPNRLLSEKSPYLLQHAYNPVQWYPWSIEAFEAARKEDKPIFLSIGYSTCHWCHVMAHESFEDPDVASLMNETFICIKVDREERPDIDQIYMAVAQAMTGRGGWPLTIIMTAEKKPFFAATYIPKNGRFGQAGMTELIPKVADLWSNSRQELLGTADRVLEYLQQAETPEEKRDTMKIMGPEAENWPATYLDRGYRELATIYDARNGGFGTAPKFPTPHNLLFLLRYWKRTNDAEALQMAEVTLQAMSLGGIYDHVGHGFHRYSTDAEWFVPHFEKMLYDQALLAMAYTEGYLATGKNEYARVARKILEYVLDALASPEGGFYSAEDADSEGVEGRFYLWSAEELAMILDKGELQLMIRLFDIHKDGNYESGANILRRVSLLEDAASVLKIPEEELCRRYEKIIDMLFLAREKRVRPHRDDKILTDWNGLMIAALARGADVLDEPRFAAAAEKAARFLLDKMKNPTGRLLHRFREEAGICANLDDYAFLIMGLIDLYETVFDAGYLKAALELNSIMLKHFWDSDRGGFFFSPDDGEALIMRRKEFYDGALPSGNSVAIYNLIRLSHLTGRTELQDLAWETARAAFRTAGEHALGHAMLLIALDYALGPTFDIALVGSPDEAGFKEMIRAIRSRFLPNLSVVAASTAKSADVGPETDVIAPYTRNMVKIDGNTTAYICYGQSCQNPTTDPKKIIELLEKTENKTAGMIDMKS
ncbi:Uncharacterised protein [uncultured archaeon]|nr:Uncharacterised protein [uncultured archaeon]